MPSYPAWRECIPINSRNPADIIAELLHLALDQIPLPRLLETALDLLFRIPWLGVMSKGSIFLVDGTDSQLVMVAERNLPDLLLTRCQTVKFGHCICGRTAAAGELIHVPCLDHRHDENFEGITPHGHVCVPIKAREKLLGVINLYVESHKELDPDAGRFLTTVADALAGIIKRSRAEQALAESEARYRSLVETINDWVWEVDCNGVYTYASPHVREMLGYEPREILGKTPFDLMPPAEARRVGAIFATIAEKQEPFLRLENTNLHKDGHEVLLETSGTPIFNQDGEFCGYRGVDRNITDKRRAEERFRSLLELAPDAIVIADDSGRIVLLNRFAETLFGYDRHELLGREIETLMPEESRAHHVQLRDVYLQNPLQRPMGSGRYLYGQRKDGTTFPVDIALGSLPTENGRLVTAMIRDISEYRHAEDELTKLASVAEHGPNPVIEFDPARTSIKNNAAAGLQFPDLFALGFEHPVLAGIDRESIAQRRAAFMSRYVEYDERIYEQKIRYMPLLDRIQVYMWEVTEVIQHLRRAEQILEEVPTPELMRRHELDLQIGRALFQSRNNNSIHALMYLRLDGLERLGRECGEPAATAALRQIMRAIEAHGDFQAALTPPETLYILLMNCDLDSARKMAREMLLAISGMRFPQGGVEWQIIADSGVTAIHRHSPPPRQLMREAENACRKKRAE